MKYKRRLYRNKSWFDFAEKVKQRDKYKCVHCGRGDVVLQAHHERYITGKAPWEYAISDCLTLCKGCHARHHELIEPSKGWFLLSVDDLGYLGGTCERRGCNTSIRYEHLIFHPEWGEMIVGSSCVDYLTEADLCLSEMLIKQYKKNSNFVHSSEWFDGETKNGKKYIYATHAHHCIRIYGYEKHYAYQVVLKIPGIKRLKYDDVVLLEGKSLIDVKELAYIHLCAKLTNDDEEKAMLRNMYRDLKNLVS